MSRRLLPSVLITLFLATMPFVLLSVENKRVALYDLAFTLPYLILILVGFLGEKLNQRRILFASIVIGVACAYLCFELPEFLGPHLRSAKGQILSIALPAMLFISFSLSEARLRGSEAMGWLALALSPLLASHLFGESALLSWLFQGRLTEGVFFAHLPNFGIFLGMLFGALGHQTEDRYLRVFRFYLAVSLVPLYYMFERTGMRFRTLQSYQLEVSLSFISSAAVLVYANFYLYWQKVYLDELTGIPNRRALNERMSVLRHHYTVAMIDIDHFKKFNDAFGHEQGDSVLRFVAKHFSRVPQGEVYRYGGEELCIIFQDINAVQALQIVEGLREQLALKDFYIRSSNKARTRTTKHDRKTGDARATKVQVTVSIGVADPTDTNQRPEHVIIAADKALYKAKERGRNRSIAA